MAIADFVFVAKLQAGDIAGLLVALHISGISSLLVFPSEKIVKHCPNQIANAGSQLAGAKPRRFEIS